MPTYLTVKEVADRLRRSEKTIRQWIDEDRNIIDPFKETRFVYKKDSAGAWLFMEIRISAQQPEDHIAKPIGPYPRRRMLSSGIK